MHVSEIAKEAVKENKNQGWPEEEFQKRLNTALLQHLKLKNKANIIFAKAINPKTRKERRGVYKLKRTASPPPPPPPPVNTLYSGKAGEYSVASELLFWGFNVSLMAVDQGVDLIAEKDGNFWYIQVKTATKNISGAFSFSIQKKAFDDNLSKRPYYIFAMREGKNTDYAIIPCDQMQRWRNSGVIGGQNLSIPITRNDKKRQYRLNGQDIDQYINDFNLI